MKNTDRELRGLVRSLLEADFRLKTSLSRMTLKLILHQDGHVPDTLTRIRVLKSVSVVGQGDKVGRHRKGRSILVIYLKFLPDTELKEYDNVYGLCEEIKRMPGVEIVRVISVNNKKVVYRGKPIVI